MDATRYGIIMVLCICVIAFSIWAVCAIVGALRDIATELRGVKDELKLRNEYAGDEYMRKYGGYGGKNPYRDSESDYNYK